MISPATSCRPRAISLTARLLPSMLLGAVLVLAAALPLQAQTIPNPSIESNAVFTNPPGYVSGNAAITGWTTNNPARVGLNPGTTFFDFADNGTIPNGARVAFVQSTGGAATTLSTTITGLTAGTWYRVQFQANSREATGLSTPIVRLNGGEAMRFAAPAVGGVTAYHTVSAIFKATATTAALEISNSTAADSTLLVDNFLITAATNITVTNNSDAAAGSLRAALNTAAGTAAFNVITFAAGLNGGTITLGSQIAVNDVSGVAIDASSLSNGLTIDGGTGENRIFLVGDSASRTALALRRLTLTSGNLAVSDSDGGAILNNAMLSLEQCTLHGNSADDDGGAICNAATGSLCLVQCTLTNNAATGGGRAEGGALYNASGAVVSLTHCTLAGNTTALFGDAITNIGALTTTNSIIRQTLDNFGSNARVIRIGANFIGTLSDDGGAADSGPAHSTPDPLLSALANNGGPTQTMALANNSPARNVSVGSTITADQRGLPLVGTADVGAFEVQGGGTFTLSATTYAAAEGGVAEIIINRVGNLIGTASVRLFTTPGTATAADFTARANSAASDVFFLDGETTKTIAIPLTADALAEGNHSFTVTLGTPAPVGATVGIPATATVTISDAIMVNTTADQFDTPSGAQVSLREALRDAAAIGGPNAIGFAPALAGQTLTLNSGPFNVTDTGGVTIDASSVGGVTLSGNSASRHFSVNGSGASLTLRRLTLTAGNDSSVGGGSIYCDNDTAVTLVECTLSGNTATAFAGGAIQNSSGTLTLTRCTLSGNSAAVGGAVYSHTPTGDSVLKTSLTQCTLSGNTASGDGGGIRNNNGITTLVHCTVTGNTAPAGEGAGLASYGDNSTETVVDKCLIAGNLTGGNVDLIGSISNNSFTSAGGNVIGSGEATADFIQPGDIINVAAPLIAALASNGGPTQTHALQPGSPALDRASGSAITRDQRGFMRNGTADSGAFESQQGAVFVLSALSYRANEGQPATVTINRSAGAFLGPATVRLFTTASSATAADYTERPNTSASDVSFADGEATKEVLIPTTTDALVEGNHSFTVSLGTPTPAPAATVGTPGTATVTIVDPILVTSLFDDGPGSLRQAFRTALANAGPDVITFSTALNGQTITLGSQIAVDDAGGVTVDATGLTAGLTIDGGPGSNRIFLVGNTIATSLTLRRLILTGGNETGFNGGAIYHNSGTLTLERCTLSGNSVSNAFGGAIYNNGTAMLTQCTLSGNSAPGVGVAGGAIFNNDTLTLTHCTLSGNSTDGSGGGIANAVSLTLDRSIVAGNTAPGISSRDINYLGDITRVGSSIVPALSGPGSLLGTGSISNADPVLGPLAANGGPTRTHALGAGSPALNAGTGSAVTSDQRGLSIVDVADIGAFETQLGGTFALGATGYATPEGAGPFIRINRLGGLEGTASVRLFTTNGSAVAPGDYTARANTAASDVTFVDGESFKDVPIFTNPDALVEVNESFTVTLGSPSAGTALGTPSSATVTLVDLSATSNVTDTVAPGVPAITTPAASPTTVNGDVGGTVTVTGSATDNKGVQSVTASLNGGGPIPMTLTQPGAPSTGFTGTVTPIAGTNSLTVTSTDFAGRSTTSATRTFKVLRPLFVGISGVGSVTAGYAPKSFREVGAPQTLTATAGTGALFAGWTILSGHTNLQLGTNATALEKTTLNFIHREGLALQANFVTNPYLASNTGTFNGAIKPNTPSATTSRLDTEGYASLNVQTTGAFSGTLKIDGLTLAVAGAFDHNGFARFGTSRAKTLSVARAEKPSLSVALNLNTSTRRITGSVVQFDAATFAILALCDVEADRAFYSATNPVPATAFNATNNRPATGTYTMYLPVTGFGALPGDQVPQGHSTGLVTVSANGTVTLTATLADGTGVGTPVVLSTTLSQFGTWRLFAQLYTGLQGALAGDVALDHSQTDADFYGVGTRWFCPLQDREHYPLGWPDGITLETRGSKFTITPGQSIVPLVQPTGTGNGNAVLSAYVAAVLNLTKNVDISTADAVTEVPADAAYSLSINRTLGTFSGSFTFVDGTVPTFSGIIFQKGASAGDPRGFGFFRTVTPAPKSYGGISGLVELTPQTP